jgi:UDP-glucuronate 4-epimerase
MAYLVTGGAGFIGSHVAEHLLQRGDEVIVLDNFNDYYDPAIKRQNIQRLQQHEKLTVIEDDIRDALAVRALFDDHNITHVAHMAAMAGVRASMEQVPLYIAVNVTGTMNLFEAAKATEIEQFVLASTGSVYGETEDIPFTETDSADRPLAAYPASKRAAELLGHTYYNLNEMNVTALRFFNVYGPAGRPDMMPLRLFNAAFDGTLIQMFNGGDIHRDWTYIDDIVNGVIAALDTPLGYEIINLGYGDPLSLTAFVDIIEELTGQTINKTSVPAPPSDPSITYCNNQKARELLGFDPVVSVQDGLLNTWEWFREYKNLD